jgi:5-methylcytosine-specific restriction enzyme A
MPERVPTHRPHAASRHRDYDRFGRDPEATAFYRSNAWRKARVVKLSSSPLCELCEAQGQVVLAEMVHHKREVRTDAQARLDLNNMQSLCWSCHSRLHGSMRRTSVGVGKC